MTRFKPRGETPQTLTEEQRQIIIGSMLGDGSMGRRTSETYNSNIIIKRQLLDKEYLLWEYERFKDFCSDKGLNEYARFDIRTNKTYYGIGFHTRSVSLFTDFRKEWYPNGIKVVPRNIELTQLIMLIWFLDDGTIFVHKTGKISGKFATAGFTKNDTEYLADLLYKRYGEYYGVHKGDKEYQFNIQFTGNAVLAIIKDIEPIFPEFMSRKAKWRGKNIKIDKSYKLHPVLDVPKVYKKLSLLEPNELITTSQIATELNLYRVDKPKKLAVGYLKHYFHKLIKDGYMGIIDREPNTIKTYFITEKGKEYLINYKHKL